MSFLTPLYLAGALAISLPIVFHLIRRTPRGAMPFSSLMFLSPSPPRITRRSRIEHWLLLALRGLALALLALAFARPFFRQLAQAGDADASHERVAIIVDTSASMRRGDLWRQAVAAVDGTIAACRPQDQVAVFASDETLRPIAGFEDLSQVPASQRRGVVADRLRALSPTWAATHTGQALLDAAALVNDSHDATEEAGRAARRVVLVSDMQSGSRLAVLGDAAWPADVQLELKPVRASKTTNAGLWRLADDKTDRPEDARRRKGEMRIRVSNAADSKAEQFELTWMSATDEKVGDAVAAYVPPGESRIVRMPPPEPGAEQPRLVLSGDDQPFDNALHVIAGVRKRVVVGYLSDDAAANPEGLRYYLQRAVSADPTRDALVEDLGKIRNEPVGAEAPSLVVVAKTPAAAESQWLRRFMRGGGTVLYVLADAAGGDGLAALIESEDLTVAEADVDGYAMLGEIDFSHPLFAAMAGPRFNDFTHIRFWKYRRIEVAETDDMRVVARFETGDPAIVERPMGDGRLTAFAAGWQPDDSQLALSWKFLLMMTALVEGGELERDFRTDYVVNKRVTLPPREVLAARLTVTTPDGKKVALPDDATAFTDATQPGVYELSGAKGPIPFAVNVDPQESDTAPVAAEAFEQLGARLAGRGDPQVEAERLEQLRDVQLEGRQRLWQWLVAIALGVLIVETWLAGHLSRRMESQLAVG